MKQIMFVPRLTSNDNEIKIIQWLIEDKKFVQKGENIVIIETSKTLVDIQSEHSGYILTHGKAGETLEVGTLLAEFYIDLTNLETSQEDRPNSIDKNCTKFADKDDYIRFSNQAKQYLNKSELDPMQFCNYKLVTTNIIRNFLNNNTKNSNLDLENFPSAKAEKITSDKKSEIRILSQAKLENLASSLTIQLQSIEIRNYLKKFTWLNGQIFPYILIVLSKLLISYPKFTAYYDKDHIVYYNKVNLGFAIDLGKGLKVAVIKEANTLTLSQINYAIIDLISHYYENSLTIEELSYSTITISDLSNDGIFSFQPLINKNQSIILGISGDKNIEGYPMTFNIVFDHRVLTGKEVALFLNKFKDNLLNEYKKL